MTTTVVGNNDIVPTNAHHGILPDGGVSPCVIKVVGVGGAGGNAVLRMIQTGVDGVEFAAINTDAQALARFKGVANTLNIGKEVTRGLGAGEKNVTIYCIKIRYGFTLVQIHEDKYAHGYHYFNNDKKY